MISYKELGLSNTKAMFQDALKNKYAVPAFNFNNLEQMQAIVSAATKMRSPVILQASKGAIKYVNQNILRYLGQAAVEFSKEIGGGKAVPIALHLDHGDSLELVKTCIDNGFSSVMIDSSHETFEKNIEISKAVVDYAHKHDVTVEAELGVLAGIEDEVSSEHSHYTDPNQVKEFVSRTGVDSLAISIGTSHGAYKFKLKPGESVPPLRFDILEECEKIVPNLPIVLHGSSSVPKEYVDMINKYGGKMENTAGIPEEQLRKAASSAVCKINIDSDGRLVFTATIRKIFAEDPAEFDPRKYIGAAREELEKSYAEKIKNVFGSNNRY